MQTYEVVAVDVHGVSGLVFIVHDDADGFVGAEVVDIPLGIIGVRVVPLIGEQEDGVVVVGSVGLVVHDPDVVAGCICDEVDLDGFGCGRVGIGGHGV